MLNSKKKWEFSNIDKIYESIDEISESIFQAHAVQTAEEIEQFLTPALTQLTSPLLFSGMAQAVERVFTAINNDELIIIYGDYDADGVTSTALMMNTLIELGANCDYFVPNRFEHGYGLNKEVLKQYVGEGASLVITVDTGIANVEEVAYAKTLNLDIIITDHHEPQSEIPDAYAIIHPKLSNECIFKEYAGVGVAFQFARQLLGELPSYLLPLATIGTVADMMPLISDNRILTYHGLEHFRENMPLGLEYLLDFAKKEKDEPITARDIGFKIGPRLNAVGRLSDANLAVELLLTMDPYVAEQIAQKIEALNNERKEIVETIVDEASKRVNINDGIIMLYDEDWHEGVLGIAASRLVRQFDRPVIMLTFKAESNELKGSARSIPGFSMFEALEKHQHLFSKFGGHDQAAGMSFPFESFLKIKQTLNDEIFSRLDAEDFKQTVSAIKKVKLESLTEKLIVDLQQFEPFGIGNEEPTFHIKGYPSVVRTIGQEGKHLKVQFKHKNRIVDAIGFNMGSYSSFITGQDEIELVGKLQINEWNGTRTVQMLIDDFRINSLQVFDFRANAYYKNFKPFYQALKSHLMVGLSDSFMSELVSTDHTNNFTMLRYGQNFPTLDQVDILYITQLPKDLKELIDIIEYYQPRNIHVTYDIIDDAFMNKIPNRDEFKWVYSYILKSQPLHSKIGLNEILKIKKWRKEKLLFIIKVFYELSFIKVKNDYILINNEVEKRALETSTTYQNFQNQHEIEQKLYYSSQQDIKEWVNKIIARSSKIKEKVSHGL